MLVKAFYIICLLASSSSLVSGDKNAKQGQQLSATATATATEAPLQNVPAKAQEMKMPSKEQDMKGMQVTGFITANGTIYDVEDKNGFGQIEARQNGQLLTPQAGEFICNYGTVVVYSDRPCDQVADVKKPATTPQAQTASVTATDKQQEKEKDQKPATEVSEQAQADDNTADGNEAERQQQNSNRPKKPTKGKKQKLRAKKKSGGKQKNKPVRRRNQNRRRQPVRVKTRVIYKDGRRYVNREVIPQGGQQQQNRAPPKRKNQANRRRNQANRRRNQGNRRKNAQRNRNQNRQRSNSLVAHQEQAHDRFLIANGNGYDF